MKRQWALMLYLENGNGRVDGQTLIPIGLM